MATPRVPPEHAEVNIQTNCGVILGPAEVYGR